MVLLPLTAMALLRLSPNSGSDRADRTVFWIETLGVWVFFIFWLLKTYEGHIYGAYRIYRDRRSISTDSARSI